MRQWKSAHGSISSASFLSSPRLGSLASGVLRTGQSGRIGAKSPGAFVGRAFALRVPLVLAGSLTSFGCSAPGSWRVEALGGVA